MEETEPQGQADVQRFYMVLSSPERGGPHATGLSEDRQVQFPKSLMDVFRGRKFADADPPEFLDHKDMKITPYGVTTSGRCWFHPSPFEIRATSNEIR